MVDLGYTSVPAWTLAPLVQEVDPGGRDIWIHAVSGSRPVRSLTTRWCAQAQAAPTVEREIAVHVIVSQDARAAVCAITATTESARVGARLMIAGTAADCAAVRAAALDRGWTDEEIRIGSTSTLDRLVRCTHCSTTTVTPAAIEGLVVCPGCARNLLVYYHFSRRTGSHLGFMVDAEDAVPVVTAGGKA